MPPNNALELMKTTAYKPLRAAPADLLPLGFFYPASFIAFTDGPTDCLRAQNEQWCLLDEADFTATADSLKRAFPDQTLVPFMQRNDRILKFADSEMGARVAQGTGSLTLEKGRVLWVRRGQRHGRIHGRKSYEGLRCEAAA